jgi:MFS family permease
MALVPRFGLILGLAVLLGLVSGGSLTLCYTIGGLMVPATVRTTAFGFFSGAALFGGAISPPLAGLVAHISLRGIYWVDAALYLALAVALARASALRALSPPAPA